MTTTDANRSGDATPQELTPPYFRHVVRLIRRYPDFDFFFIKSLRKRAVQRLQLKPGDRVLDAGCGPGGSFPHLVAAVGPSGEVVGVEISPEVTINAQNRIENNHWSNVRVITSDAASVELKERYDGLLMFGAPDVYASSQALANIVRSLNLDARFVAFGAKLSRRRLGRFLNSAFSSMFSKATFASTPALDYEPWKTLEGHASTIQVEEYFFGWMFLAWGVIEPTKATQNSESVR